MEKVPEDLFPTILSYINPKHKYNLNKILFYKYYEQLNALKIYGAHAYLAKVVSSDFSFIFDNICKIKWYKWISLKNWHYKEYKFDNFTKYILFLINNSQAHKCKNIFFNYNYKSFENNTLQ